LSVGYMVMSSENLLEALDNLLYSGVAHRMVSATDWSIMKPLHEARRARPFLEEVGERPLGGAQPASESSNLFYRLKDTGGVKQKAALLAQVEDELRRILDLNPNRVLDKHRGFFDMGMDSLMSIEFKKRLENSFGCSLPPALTFTYPNITVLVDYLADEVLRLEAQSSEVRPPLQSTRTVPDELPDEDVEASLLKALEKAGY
jgi:acyl carrier protein